MCFLTNSSKSRNPTNLNVEVGEKDDEGEHVAYLEAEPSYGEATGPNGCTCCLEHS